MSGVPIHGQMDGGGAGVSVSYGYGDTNRDPKNANTMSSYSNQSSAHFSTLDESIVDTVVSLFSVGSFASPSQISINFFGVVVQDIRRLKTIALLAIRQRLMRAQSWKVCRFLICILIGSLISSNLFEEDRLMGDTSFFIGDNSCLMGDTSCLRGRVVRFSKI